MLEYVRQFDQLSRYAPDMIQTETSKVWRFLSRLRLSLAGLVDTRRDGPESYTDAVGRAIRHESWAKTDKGLSLGTGCNTTFTPPDAKSVNEMSLAFENIITNINLTIKTPF